MTALWPTLVDVEHVFFWALLVTAIALILAVAFYMCEAFGSYLAIEDDSEDRRRQLQKVFPGHFGARR